MTDNLTIPTAVENITTSDKTMSMTPQAILGTVTKSRYYNMSDTHRPIVTSQMALSTLSHLVNDLDERLKEVGRERVKGDTLSQLRNTCSTLRTTLRKANWPVVLEGDLADTYWRLRNSAESEISELPEVGKKKKTEVAVDKKIAFDESAWAGYTFRKDENGQYWMVPPDIQTAETPGLDWAPGFFLPTS